MKKVILLFLLLTGILQGYATVGPLGKHNIELSMSLDMTYDMFVLHRKQYASLRQSRHQYVHPFLGGSLGVNYIYRPINPFAISVGVNNQITGYYLNKSDPDPAYNYKAYSFTGYISFPILFYLTIPVKNSYVEITNGPEFYIPYYYLTHTVDGSYSAGNSVTHYLSDSKTIKYNASMGWRFQVGTYIPLSEKCNLFIGPELGLVDMVRLYNSPYANNRNTRLLRFAFGIKLGFRFKVGKT